MRMPNKVTTEVIVKSLAEGLKNEKCAEKWISFARFKDILIEQDVYSSDPSIRNAWKRVKGTQYCRGVTGSATRGTLKMFLNLSWMRQDFGLEILEEQANKKKETDAVGEAF